MDVYEQSAVSMSEEIDKFAPAFASAWAEIEAADKAKVNKGISGVKYADMDAVMDVVKPPCVKYRLVVSQNSWIAEGQAHCYTQVTHESGQWMRWYSSNNTVAARPPTNECQAGGISKAYTERYAMMGVFRLVCDDGDGVMPKGATSTSRGTDTNVNPKGAQSATPATVEGPGVFTEEEKVWMERARKALKYPEVDYSKLTRSAYNKLKASLVKEKNEQKAAIK